MSNVTPIRPSTEPPTAALEIAIAALLFDVESGTIGAALATDALEEIEDQMATDVNDNNRGLYAHLFLIREKLRRSIEEIERASGRARAAVYTGEANREKNS